MKRISVLMILALLCVAAVPTALGLTVESVAFGGDNQVRGVTIDATIDVENDGADDLKDVTLSFQNEESEFLLDLSATDLGVIAAGATVEVTLSAFVPKNLDAVDNAGSELVHAMATLVATGTNASDNVTTITSTGGAMTMQAENQLEVENVVVSVNGDPNDVSDGDDIEDVLPGDEVCIEVEIENLFSDDDNDPEFEDARVEVESNDQDFRYSDSESFSDIGPDDTTSESLKCEEVDNDADGNVQFDVLVLGTASDSNDDDVGGIHGEQIDFTIKIDREDHEVLIEDLDLLDSRITTGTRTTELSFRIFNRGSRNEDRTSYEVRSADLGIDIREGDISIKKSKKSSRRTVTLPIPAGVEPGTYLINVRVTPRPGESVTDTQTVELTIVEASNTGRTPTPTPPQTVTQPTPPQTTPQPTTPVQPPVIQPPVVQPPTQQPATDGGLGGNSGLYVGLLVGGIVLVVLFIALLLVVAFRRK